MMLGKLQCQGDLLICIIVGQGPSVLAVGAGFLNILSSFFSSLGDGPI